MSKISIVKDGDSEGDLFIYRAMALVWSFFYDTEPTEESNLLTEFQIVSYAHVLQNKCVVLKNKRDPNVTYEVTYDGSLRRTIIASYLEVQRYDISDEETNTPPPDNVTA